MRILTWNILHGGGPTRLPEIILSLLRHAPDLLVLTEFRVTRGSQIRAVLADHGLVHQLASHPRGQTARNGVLVASRDAIESATCSGPRGCEGRWLEVFVPALALHVLGVHVPDDTRLTEKAAYWQAIVAMARRRSGENCLILGDFNTGRTHQDAPPPPSRPGPGWASVTGCEALLGTPVTLGFVDAWRRLNPAAREFSWVSSEGQARRIDTVYLSPPIVPLLQTAVYSHFERTAAYSDHAPLVVDLDVGPLRGGVSSGRAGRPTPAGLFSFAAVEPAPAPTARGESSALS